MTTLYRPVLIESAEQAEALPIGTIALLRPEQPEAYENHAAVKAGPEDTSAGVPLWLVDSQGTAEDAGMVGWTALVPIEAEEETRGGPLDNDWDWDSGPASPPTPTPATRLVTPWEEAPPAQD